MFKKERIRSVLCLVLFTLILFTGYAQESTETNKTKLEQFSTKTGVVLVRGFHKIGSTTGLYSTSVNVQSKEFINVSDETREYGITVESFKEDGRYDKSHTSFIDYDEIDSLIEGINYISSLKSDVTKLKDFQADYKTRSNLEISTFSSGRKILAAVTSGTIGGVTAYFNLTDLEKVKLLIIKAKEKIDSIRV